MNKAALTKRTRELQEMDDRERSCRAAGNDLREALRAVAARSTSTPDIQPRARGGSSGTDSGRVPRKILDGDTTLVIKIDKLRDAGAALHVVAFPTSSRTPSPLK